MLEHRPWRPWQAPAEETRTGRRSSKGLAISPAPCSQKREHTGSGGPISRTVKPSPILLSAALRLAFLDANSLIQIHSCGSSVTSLFISPRSHGRRRSSVVCCDDQMWLVRQSYHYLLTEYGPSTSGG